jgi:hypothetical protein
VRIVFISLLALIVTAAACPAFEQQDQSGKGTASPAADVCPDTVPWTGKYQNHSFGFTIVIPENLKGFWNSARCSAGPDGCTCMGDHGRIIPLTAEPSEPERYIEAYAGHSADLDKPTVAAEVRSHLGWIRERSRNKSIQIRKRSYVRLAGLKGQRLAVRYFDKELKTWFIEDFVELVRLGRIEYSLYLRTREEVYQHDRAIFETVISSFALTSGEYTD